MNAVAGLYDNPILHKHIRSRLRPQHVIPSVVVVVIICGCILWGGHLLNAMKDGGVFTTLFLVQWGLLVVMGTSQVATAVAHAKDSGILDFHRVSPLPASWVTTGFLFGAPIREYVLFACTLPFSFVPALMGTPGVVGLMTIYPVLFASMLMFHALAVLVGLVSKKPRGAGGSVVAIAMFAHFIGLQGLLGGANALGLITVIPAYSEAMRQLDPRMPVPGFFGVEMPLFAQSLVYQFALLGFVFVAAVRKMRSDRAHAYSKPLATAFLATIAALGLGSLWSIAAPAWMGRISSLWTVVVLLYVTVVAAVLLTNSVTPSASEFANGLRRAHKHGHGRLEPWHDFATNHWTVLVFCAIVAVAAAIAYFLLAVPNNPTGSFWAATFVAVLVVAYFGNARQYFELAFGKRGMPYFLLFLFLAWVLPVIVGSILAMTRWGEDAALPILSVSPLVGITTAAGIEDFRGAVQASRSTNLPFSATFTILFGLLAVQARRRAEASVRNPASAP
jgi:hypothetical protein